MKRSLVPPMGLVIGLVMASCGDTTPTARSTTTTAEPELREVSDVLYQEDLDGTRHELTVHAPATDGGPRPVVVMIHGFGGDRLLELGIGVPEPAAVATEGLVVFVPTWPEPQFASAEAALAEGSAIVERLACSVRFARAEAERYGGDPSNVSLYGESAGANFASMVALAEPVVPEGCVAPTVPAVPDSLVLFEGDWLLAGGGRLGDVWDDLLEEDPRVMDAGTPWSYLEEAARMPIRILDSDDLTVARTVDDTDGWLALRDPTGSFRRGLEELGAFDDGVVSFREAQLLLYERLIGLGYDVTFDDLPDSTHDSLSEAGVQGVVDAIRSAR